jgi:hypothetical protein
MKTAVPLLALGLALPFWASTIGPADAQSWQWQVPAHGADAPQAKRQSQVTLSPTDVTMSYSVDLHQRQALLASCHVPTGSIERATEVQNAGGTFVILYLKPPATADCNSGRQPIAMVPVADDSSVLKAVAAINRACCTAVVAVRPVPTATPSPASALPHLGDWVENSGLFSFVRVYNTFSKPITVTAGSVDDCRNVEYGCGPLKSRGVTLQPGSSATIATIVSSARGNGAAFSYHYNAESDQLRFSGIGSSRDAPESSRRHMSANEIREAEALAIGDFRSQNGSKPNATAARTPPPAFVAAAISHRGSSRLGIGQTGVARVRVNLDSNGSPQGASIESTSNGKLVAAALETAVSSTYTPELRYGRAVPSTYLATFQFDGDDPSQATVPVWRRSPMPKATSGNDAPCPGFSC